jgi:protein TonB
MPEDRQVLPDAGPVRTQLVAPAGDPDRRRGIVAAALGVSAAAHLLIFIGPLIVIPSPWHETPPPAIEVELVEAPPEPEPVPPEPEPPKPAEPEKPKPKPIDFSALAPPELTSLPDAATPAQQAAAAPPPKAVPAEPATPPAAEAEPSAPEPHERAEAKAEPEPPAPPAPDATELADAAPAPERTVSDWSPLPPTSWAAASAAAPLPADRPTQVELLAERMDETTKEPSTPDIGAYLIRLRAQVFAQQASTKRPRLPAKALVRLVIARDGRLLDRSVAASSGDPAVDARVLTLVAQAQPFPPLPAVVKGDRLTIDAPMVFLLR